MNNNCNNRVGEYDENGFDGYENNRDVTGIS